MDRKKLLNIAENDDEKILVSRIIDAFTVTTDKNIIRNTPFLNGHEINLAKKVASHFNVAYDFYGGYSEAERCMLVCYPDFLYPENTDGSVPLKP